MTRAFTLIELLIVVAIIGILAAIAVPNFLNARARATISRSYADIRSLQTAIESFRLDKNVMLVDFYDDDTAIGQQRIVEKFHGVGGTHNQRGGTTGILTPLTTPIAYIGSIPQDPFAVKMNRFNDFTSTLIAADQLPPISYLYFDNDPQIEGTECGALVFCDIDYLSIPSLKEGEYVLVAYGPDSRRNNPPGYGYPYASSNGLKSLGDIWLRSGGMMNDSY
ncbi:MAG: prepilin-type N-terminal cleavage/methylation domain-containing protein [bacterium]